MNDLIDTLWEITESDGDVIHVTFLENGYFQFTNIKSKNNQGNIYGGRNSDETWKLENKSITLSFTDGFKLMSGEINSNFDSMEGKYENQQSIKGEWSGKYLTKSKLKSTTSGDLSSAEGKNKSMTLLELEHSLAEQHKLYLKDSENVISDTNLRQEEWITNSPLSSEKFSNDIFESLCKNTNKKLVFELLKNPYFPQEYLSELVDVQATYSNDELYLLWLILKHPNCPERVLKQVSELIDSYEISLLKKAIALNPNAKKSVVQELLKNDYRWVRQATASHPSIERKDILELIKLAETGITKLQKENQEGDRYTLKGLLENKNLNENLKKIISNLLEDEGTYPKQYITYSHGFSSESYERVAAGEIPLEIIVSILIDNGEYGFSDIASTLNESDDWTYYTDFYDSLGWFEGGGCLYITDLSIDLEEEEFEIDSYEIGDKFILNYINKLEIGTFFFEVESYNRHDDGSLDDIEQEEELNIWECINDLSFDMFNSNTIFGYPELSVSETDYDRKSTLYVKDSKNGFTEVSLDVLYDEVHKKFGDELSEENVIKYLKNKYKK
jgi:hypothetical protein